jgi:hypothetical protein
MRSLADSPTYVGLRAAAGAFGLSLIGAALVVAARIPHETSISDPHVAGLQMSVVSLWICGVALLVDALVTVRWSSAFATRGAIAQLGHLVTTVVAASLVLASVRDQFGDASVPANFVIWPELHLFMQLPFAIAACLPLGRWHIGSVLAYTAAWCPGVIIFLELRINQVRQKLELGYVDATVDGYLTLASAILPSVLLVGLWCVLRFRQPETQVFRSSWLQRIPLLWLISLLCVQALGWPTFIADLWRPDRSREWGGVAALTPSVGPFLVDASLLLLIVSLVELLYKTRAASRA